MSEIYYITGSLFFPILNVFFDKNHRKTKLESRKTFPAFRYLNAGGKKKGEPGTALLPQKTLQASDISPSQVDDGNLAPHQGQ